MGSHWGLGLHFIFATIFLIATTNTCMACFKHEQIALLEFKQSVEDDYDMLSSWIGNDCCRWERVTCDHVTRNVVSLHLRSSASVFDGWSLVSNELSTSLAELRHLKYLDLSSNNFQGSRIPKFMGSLKQLTYLNLSYASFSGIIPHHIGNLSNLMNLDLSFNGYIQNSLMAHDMTWISGLSSLEHLDLSGAIVSGAKNLDMVFYIIPSLKELRLSNCGLSNVDLGLVRNSSTSLSNIKRLDLSWNSFKGQPPHFFRNLTFLQFIDLSSFHFSPTWNFANFLSMIPSLLGLRLSHCNLKETHLSHIQNLTSLSNIQYLDLSWNQLTGPIPTFPEKLTVLYLSKNYLNGSILVPPRKLRLLQVLDLSNNKLTGPISTFLRELIELYLSDNNLNDSVPESIGRSTALTELYLSNNQLSGSIPVSIRQLSKLRSLDISNNSLEGVVFESHFANLSMLEYLNTRSNSKLTFSVSHEWLPPFQLIDIDLSSCKIENGFPQWLRNQKRLQSLDLSNASISGPLPTWLRKIPIIPYVDLSHNNLSGPLTNLPNRRIYKHNDGHALFLQNNLFNKSIPRSLCNMTNLFYLDLSRNRLTGEIPNCLKNLQNLWFLKLNSNELSGVIPHFIGNFSLGLLNLNDNNFIGELPAEIWNISSLNVLDLGDNALTGKIPESIGVKFALQVFRLHNNSFTGEIPRSLCNSFMLQILDVAHNNLTGTIPHCLGELLGMVNDRVAITFGDGTEEGLRQVMKGTTLEYTNTWSFVTNMDLSSNKLVGDIPVELTALSALVGLNLSNNDLSGGIPNNIGNMTELNSLDLSGNELGGRIPPSIAALNFLSHLNLSNNNLSGKIPTGNQLQTLIDPSVYAGNKYLCGAPLPKNCSNHEESATTSKRKYEATDEPKKVWFYVDITCGFAIGFWGVIVVLVLKKQWRHKLFMFAEESMDKIHVTVMVRVNKMKRGSKAI